MSENLVKIEVEIDFEHGKETIEMVMKEPFEVEECKVGLIVMLNLQKGQTYTGIFHGIDDCTQDVILQSIQGGSLIGLKSGWIEDYFEQVSS